MSDAPCLAELEQSRLATLNLMASRTGKGDGLCAYCGLRPARPQLCEVCEGRRQALQARYPGVGRQRIFHEPEGMTRMADLAPKEWLPYPSEE